MKLSHSARPVLGLDGRVVAINAAILPEFGGSNLGVPAVQAHKLLERVQARSARSTAPLPSDLTGADPKFSMRPV